MFKIIISLTIFFTSISAYAQMPSEEKRSVESRVEGTFPKLSPVTRTNQYKMHMGLTAGMVNPNGDVESSPEYGINLGFQPYIPVGLGAEITTSEIDNTTIQRTNLLVRGTYNLGGDVPVLRSSYLGLITGPMFQTQDGDTQWSVGPVTGFDIPLQDKSSDYLSLGLAAKYLYTTNIQDTFAAGVALKYWY